MVNAVVADVWYRMILAFDTETTGLPEWKLPSDDPAQPHLLQIAALLFDDDGTELDRLVTMVCPGMGAVMSPEGQALHGLTLERAQDEGADPINVACRFVELAAGADLIVGHNVSFDARIMRIMTARHLGYKWEPTCPTFCTMRRSQGILRGSSLPTLGECIQRFFGESLEGAHDALADAQATARVFRFLTQELGEEVKSRAEDLPSGCAPNERDAPRAQPLCAEE